MATSAAAAPSTEDRRGALDDVRVIELGSLIAGPFAGRLLADMGADVIKVEAPGQPDPLREWGNAEVDGHRVFWTVHARNKRCVTLDLRQARGQEILLDLVERADVLIESFRPGTLERWGLSYDTLRARNPGLVLARVSGYGQTGPMAHRPGYASVAEAVSGLRALNGFPDGPPPRLAVSIGDSLAGMFALQGILGALHARARSGRGQVVDTALSEACLAVTESMVPDYDAGGVVRRPSGTRLEGIAPSNLYETSDGRWVIIAANQDTLFRRLCQAMGRPDLAADRRFADHVARGQHQDDIDRIVAAWARTLSAEELFAVLDRAGVVAGPVRTVDEVVTDPQLLARDMIVAHYDETLGREVLGPGIVPRLSDTPGRVRWAGCPRPGTHNAEVYGDLLGYDETELAALAKASVI